SKPNNSGAALYSLFPYTTLFRCQHEELPCRHFERDVVDDGRPLIPFGALVERDRHRWRTLASARYEGQSCGSNKMVIGARKAAMRNHAGRIHRNPGFVLNESVMVRVSGARWK